MRSGAAVSKGSLRHATNLQFVAGPVGPPDPPPSGDKPNILYGAAEFGLSSVFQDQFHVSDPPSPASDLWAFSPGGRNAAVAPPSLLVSDTVIMETVTLGGKPARRVQRWMMPYRRWFGWVNTLVVTGAAKGAVIVDAFIPSDCEFRSADGKTDGKTAIGLVTAPAGTPNFNLHNLADGGNRWPWEQAWNGGAVGHHGLNFSTSGGNLRFKLYSHSIRIGGAAQARKGNGQGGLVGTSFIVPKDRWVTIEMYIEIDTNGQNGVLSVWLTDAGVTTRVIHYTNLDFGGALGTRNYATLPREGGFTWGISPQGSLNITAPAKVRGLLSRHMPGGWGGGDTTADRNLYWNQYTTGRWNLYNWRYWQGS